LPQNKIGATYKEFKKIMKNISLSVFIIMIMAVFAVGSTVAFFSDTEESGTSIISVGALDLKVNSESSYNKLICVDEFWTEPDPVICEELSIKSTDLVKLFKGGIYDECVENGFTYGIAKWEWEEDEETGEFVYMPEGSSNGTTVLGSAELAEWWSTWPIAGIVWKAGQGIYIAGGGTSGIVASADGDDNKDISHITFCGDDDSYCGDCILDEGEECDGSLGVPEGSYCTADCKLIPKKPCVGTWVETDLEDGVHKFFNFYDIKPGDYGEDTISLHVYDNDAWGRLIINNIKDNENSCEEPEYDDEPNCNVSDSGELRQNMLFKLWLDMGSVPGFQNSNKTPGEEGYDDEEGDNIYQDIEPVISDSRPLDIEGEMWDFREVLSEAYNQYCQSMAEDGHNNYGECHGVAADGRMVGSCTYYLGMSWELPASTNNEAQSDSFSGDIIFEIEHLKGNPDPFTIIE